MSGSGGSSCSIDQDKLNRNYNLSVTLVGIVLFIVGIVFGIGGPYLFKRMNPSNPIKERAATFIQSGPQKTAQYGPTIVLFTIAFCFLVGILYVLENRVRNKSKEDAKRGIQTAVGLAWGLFVLTAILVPFAVHYAHIPLGSYYYFFATAFVFYFTCVVVIIIFHNKLRNVDPTNETLDMTDTHNIQNGLIAGLVAYGIGAFLML